MQQLCCWKRVDRSGERGSRRHWWADNAPSLMMMLMIIMILTLMMLTFVTIMMGREALEGMYWWADKTPSLMMMIMSLMTFIDHDDEDDGDERCLWLCNDDTDD